jgi:DNA-binding beta-propeller fold protein YncE
MSVSAKLKRSLGRKRPEPRAHHGKRQRTAALQNLADQLAHLENTESTGARIRPEFRQVLECGCPLPLSVPASLNFFASFFRAGPSQAGLAVLLATASLLLAGCVSQTGVRARNLAPPAPPPYSPPGGTNLPGARPDGSVLLPNQWSLRPAGAQIELRDFPVNIAVHPAGKFAAVLHSGYSANQISIVDLTIGKAVSHANIEQSFYGLQFSRDGKRLFCSGAGHEVVHQFDFERGALGNHKEIRVRDIEERGIPAGLAVDKSAGELFVANLWADRVSRVRLQEGSPVIDIPLRTNAAPLLHAGPGAVPDFDKDAAEKRRDAGAYRGDEEAALPYTCCLDEEAQRLYVSLWAQSSVAVVDLKSNRVITRWATEEHPNEMVLSRSGKILFVANANRNTVTLLNTATGKKLETIWAALYPNSPPGSTPNSLALTPDERLLFVANANVNVVAVFDISTPGKSRSLGFIPTGWYPTSVRVTPDGKRLLVANGKGVISRANPHGPQPGHNSTSDPTVEYIGRLFHGTLSVIDLPPGVKFEEQLRHYTAEAYRCAPLKPDAGVASAAPEQSPIPRAVGESSPIKYVIYMVKENRTYDQVLGDMAEGNGDASLCLFPEKVTPNEHQFCREFVLLDNFYAEAEVSADGHEWTMGAYATDFVEKMWPLMYGHNQPRKYAFPAEGNFPIATPAGGYLWDRAKEAGVTYRSYGEFVDLTSPSSKPAVTLVKSLKGHIDPGYPGFDLDYPDIKRAARFISELRRFETEGGMPRLQIVRLGNDHTHGVSRGKRTPSAYVAENDLAFGQIVEAVSHSKFWAETAIFAVEDDAQNGPDHVDAHRTTAYVISPYVKRKSVDSTMYSTSSMLRTIELILGLKPMSQFDAAAAPMFNSFQSQPDLTPYTALPANVDLEAKNVASAWGSEIKMNFAKEDAADDLLLNEVIWRSVRGANSPMPAPVRAGFVFVPVKDADGDE